MTFPGLGMFCSFYSLTQYIQNVKKLYTKQGVCNAMAKPTCNKTVLIVIYMYKVFLIKHKCPCTTLLLSALPGHATCCCQIEISPEFGSFLGYFWQKLKSCAIVIKMGAFQELFLIEIMCYFGSYFNALVAFRSFLGCFWPILKMNRNSVLFSENSRI